jgi:mRNA-degrading endonuclease toxin of MazEF toxin-antitoxin module
MHFSNEPISGKRRFAQRKSQSFEKSVANISKVITVDKSDLKDKIGSLSPERTQQIISGIKLLVEPLPDPRS